jgi:hypothetical protein
VEILWRHNNLVYRPVERTSGSKIGTILYQETSLTSLYHRITTCTHACSLNIGVTASVQP